MANFIPIHADLNSKTMLSADMNKLGSYIPVYIVYCAFGNILPTCTFPRGRPRSSTRRWRGWRCRSWCTLARTTWPASGRLSGSGSSPCRRPRETDQSRKSSSDTWRRARCSSQLEKYNFFLTTMRIFYLTGQSQQLLEFILGFIKLDQSVGPLMFSF